MGELLLTSGYDKKALIWKWKQNQKPLLIVDSLQFEDKFKKNISIPEEISAAQFYYMDKFILLTYGNILNMYLYNLDFSKSDIESYKMKSEYQTILSLTLESKRITALSAVNQFYSCILFIFITFLSLFIINVSIFNEI
ncbi:WD repeat-containing protein 27-like [Centruroides sculpturatus]|uniref:WD repeat-containing protein 27-like n=1 Tax=Centruroides sculpturatus TaxID=218467 RepID=UPI000C6E0E35|nr:WD repeat-containing protein 27-like [Centruroides sculpturatus]